MTTPDLQVIARSPGDAGATKQPPDACSLPGDCFATLAMTRFAGSCFAALAVTRRMLVVSLVIAAAGCAAAPAGPDDSFTAEPTIVKRAFAPRLDGRWIGNGISYGAYRDGEAPGSLTSKAHILEDLRIIVRRWNFIRLYAADRQSRRILEVIREHGVPVRVMLGAWVSSRQTAAQNEAEILGLIELANEFREIVIAVNVGNEIFVDWSAHRIADMDTVIGWIRRVRAAVSQPVTVSDDYNFWNTPEAGRIAARVDFIGLHAYAFWNNKTLAEAMHWTTATYRAIAARYPGHVVVFAETGWPTSRVYGDGSYEGGLIGRAGEKEQARFFTEYDSWVDTNRINSLYFEAFDERWKGGFDGVDPFAKAEKHWGLYRSDRTPKRAIR